MGFIPMAGGIAYRRSAGSAAGHRSIPLAVISTRNGTAPMELQDLGAGWRQAPRRWLRRCSACLTN
jgi:hypothetical protein